MAIKLSNLTFTDEDDTVFTSRVEEVFNTEVANTLAGDDRITATGNDYGFENVGILNTDEGNDIITTIESLQPEFDSSYDIINSGTLNTDNDNDIITGISRGDGIFNSGSLNADESNDIITGTTSRNARGGYGRLIIHSIKCLKNGADIVGPDDTFITVNGIRRWGDYNMSTGQTRSVNYDVNVNYAFQSPGEYPLWIQLFDDDTGWSRPDPVGGFAPVETNGTAVTQQVQGCGSIYEVYYTYRDPLTPFPYSYTVPAETGRRGGGATRTYL
jgi:hypothetical protein